MEFKFWIYIVAARTRSIEDVILSEAKNLAVLCPSQNQWRRRCSREVCSA